jgi:hypothetical protein
VDTRGPDEHPGERASLEPLDPHRGLERLALGAVVVPADRHVKDPQGRGVEPGEPWYQLAREQNEPGARGEDRKSRVKSVREMVPQPGLHEEASDRGRLATGEKEGADPAQLLGSADREDVVPREDRGERRKGLRDVALQGEDSYLHLCFRSSSMNAFARSNRIW